MDKWTVKKDMINQYFLERETPTRSQSKRDLKKNCKWCEKFRELDFYHCLHCGSVFK